MEVLEYIAQEWYEENAKKSATSASVEQQHQPVPELLWQAVENGWIEEIMARGSFLRTTEFSKYKFVHDKYLLAAYLSIGSIHVRSQYHLLVGNSLRKLHEMPTFGKEKWMIILAADNIYKGRSQLPDSNERVGAARLLYLASLELEAISAFTSAAIYAANAIQLLGEDPWSREYELTLELYDFRAKMEFCSGKHKVCRGLIDVILESATHDINDKATAYNILTACLTDSCLNNQSIRTSISWIRELKVAGARLPFRVSQARVLMEFQVVSRMIKKRDEQSLFDRADASSKEAANCIQALSSVMACAWMENRPNMMLFFALRCIKVSLRHGYTCHTTPSIGVYGIFSAALGNLKETERIGRVVFHLTKRFRVEEVNTLNLFIYYGCFHHLSNGGTDICGNFAHVQRIGTKSGNVTWGFASQAAQYYGAMLNSSIRLDKLICLTACLREEQIRYNKTSFLQMNKIVRQCALNFLGHCQSPTNLEGDEIKELAAHLSVCIQQNSISVRVFVSLFMVLVCFFGDTGNNVLKQAKRSLKVWKIDIPSYCSTFQPFLRGLIWCMLYRQSGRLQYVRRCRKELNFMKKYGALGILNQRAMHAFVEADFKAMIGETEAGDTRLFDSAIEQLDALGLKNWAALCAERAASITLKNGATNCAAVYLGKARAVYKEWRALGKLRSLKSEYPDILSGLAGSSAFSVYSIESA